MLSVALIRPAELLKFEATTIHDQVRCLTFSGFTQSC